MLYDIKTGIKLEKITDISLGYDYISAAMGQIIALIAGAYIIFSVTPSEYIAMPDEEDTKQGCIIAKIVYHSADIAKGKDRNLDNDLSMARQRLDWQGQINFAVNESNVDKLKPVNIKNNDCSVCGDFCALKLMNLHIKNKKK